MHEPHKPTHCPACRSERIVRGSVASGEGAVVAFALPAKGFFSLRRWVPLMAGTRFFACRDCELVWSNLVPGHLALQLDDD